MSKSHCFGDFYILSRNMEDLVKISHNTHFFRYSQFLQHRRMHLSIFRVVVCEYFSEFSMFQLVAYLNLQWLAPEIIKVVYLFQKILLFNKVAILLRNNHATSKVSMNSNSVLRITAIFTVNYISITNIICTRQLVMFSYKTLDFPIKRTIHNAPAPVLYQTTHTKEACLSNRFNRVKAPFKH